MSFLNRSILQERAVAATVEKHPLLKECDVLPNVKQAYLQGCVLAVLERDDGKVTDAARQELLKLGKSLELSDADCAEAISIVSALQTPEDQGQFLEELFSTLSEARYAQYFLSDFENHLKKNGQLSEDAKKILDMFKDALTRNSVSSHQDGMNGGSCVDAKQNHPVSADWASRPTYEIRAHIRAIPIHLNVPEWRPMDSVGAAYRVYSPTAYTIFVEPVVFDPNNNNWIENAEERQTAIRKQWAWNQYVQSEDVVRYIRKTILTAIPGVQPVFVVASSTRWSLPECEYRRLMSVVPCGYNMRGDELGCYICKGFCCDNEEVSWDEPIHEFDLPNGLSWTGLGLDSEEDEYSEIERVFGRDGFEVDLTSFKKGERMRFPDGRIQEIKTYGDVYRYFSEHCEFA